MSSPTDIFVTGGVVREQAANGTVVATLSTEDADAGDTFTYAIVSDPTGSFVIVGNEIRVANGATLDFETAQILPITVEVTDGTGNVLEKVIGISVTDMNEIAGTADSDTIYGTVGGDIIDAGDGYDTVYGDAGDDVINGGDGGGYLLGGFGDDVIEGGMGVDTLDGNQGVNTLRGGDGNDYLYGHEGAGGTLEGGAGDDYISGSSTTGAAQSISGGDGADTVHINGQLHTDTVDLGAGDDRIHTNVGQNTITLGDGADTVVLSSVFVPPPMPGMPAPDMQQGVVTDFVAGAGGDKIDITSLLNSYGLTGFDGSINPFGSGHLRLAQDGADTLFQVDPNGSADGEQFHTLLRLQNTTATELTADNFFPAWPPDGSAPLGQTIVGTVDGETIYGTVGGDTIDAGDGYDTVYGDAGDDVINGGEGGGNLFGGFGDDVIEGGSGDDTLDGNQGANTLRGGDGNDYLYGHEGAGGTLEGGAGNDYISGSSTTGAVQSISGGDGADTVHINGQLHTDTVDLGAGDDRIHTNVGQNTITLGDGVDTVVLSSVFVPPPMPGMPQSAPNVQQGVVTDFVAGAGGDKIDITSLLSSYGLTGFDGNANPFGSGHLRLAQDGTDTVLQADLSGSADGEQFHTLLRLQNTTATELTADNFFPAWPPDGSAPLGQTIVGTVDGETIYGTVGGDTIDAGDGYDTVYGDAGDDVINGGDGGGYLLGGFGDDVIEGGSGVDTLDGNQGVNTLRGGDGNDYLYGHEGAGGTLEGGAGNDYISGSSTTGAAQSISGGDGADTVHINGQLHTDTVDLGAGDDRIHTNVGQNTITLGDGVDTVVLSSVFVPPPMPGMPPSAPNVQQGVVTDFVAGAGGDKIDSTSLLSSYGLTGFDGNANPFGSGHLRLAQDGTDTLLQADLSGSTDGEQFHTLLRLQNTTATELTADNFFPAWPPTVGIYVPNDAPTDIQLSGDSVMENTWGGVVVGTLTGTDPNAGDTLYFTLVDSAGGQFQIVDAGDAGWQLQTWWGLDHETTPTVDIVVRVLDQNGAYYNETLTITVNDAPPTDISTYSFLGVDENAPSGWFISTLQGLSSDFPDTMEFTLLDDAGGRFGLVHEAWMLPDQVGLVVAPGADIDYETATSYDITVRVSNSGGTYDETFTVQVNDLFETDNQAPTNLMLSGNQVFENSAWGTVVGYVSATDAPGDSIWYSLDDDADGWFMLVNDGMGGAQLQVSGAIDFEAIHDRDVTIRATDQLGASTLLTVPVQILNVTGNFAGDGNPNFIVGTDEEDNVQGNGGDDEIHGGLGNDNLNGNGGNDSIFGNAGSDNLSGGGGDDLLSGGAGFDFFTPGSGADVVDGSPGSAIEDGYDDRDTVGYQDGNNGVGIVANLSDEEITVSVGGVAAPVTVAGNTARDWSGATDQLIDIERVRGSNQADYIRGSDTTNFRQEQFEGLAGADTIDGGAGFDRVRYSSDANFGGTAGVNVNLAAGVAIDGFGDTDTLFNIDAVIATNADDILVGNDQRNVFRNLGGSDQIDGGGGNDAISIYVTDTFGFPGGTVDLDMGYAIGLAAAIRRSPASRMSRDRRATTC